MSHEVCHIRCQTTSESCCHNINITQNLLEQMSEYIAKNISDDMWHEPCHSKCQTIWLCWCQVFVWTLKELDISIYVPITYQKTCQSRDLSQHCDQYDFPAIPSVTSMSNRAKAQTSPVRHSIGFAYAVQKAMDMAQNHQIWNYHLVI